MSVAHPCWPGRLRRIRAGLVELSRHPESSIGAGPALSRRSEVLITPGALRRVEGQGGEGSSRAVAAAAWANWLVLSNAGARQAS